ncbi:MAG TPA: hypothetical protein VGC55_12025 [Dokdonella sp.]
MFFYGPFRAFRPRHPVARFVTGVLGAIAVLLLIALGMFTIAALAIGGGLFLLINALRSPQRPAATGGAAPRGAPPAGVIEGEFTVVPVQARDSESSR